MDDATRLLRGRSQAEISERGASGKSPARMRLTSRATHASNCSRNFAHRPGSASHASTDRLPDGSIAMQTQALDLEKLLAEVD